MSEVCNKFKNLSYKFLSTDSKDYTLTVLRLSLGFFMFYHGAQKMWGAFGGPGYEGAIGFLTGMGLPWIIAFLVIVGEALGGIALMVGFKVRFMAFASIIILLGAIFMVHLKEGFMGYELHVLAISISIAVMIKGAGALSLDSVMSKWFK